VGHWVRTPLPTGDGRVDQDFPPDGRRAQGVRTPLPPRRVAIIGPRTRALVRALRAAPVSFETDALRRRTRPLTRNIVVAR